jgi:hypothetical protein
MARYTEETQDKSPSVQPQSQQIFLSYSLLQRSVECYPYVKLLGDDTQFLIHVPILWEKSASSVFRIEECFRMRIKGSHVHRWIHRVPWKGNYIACAVKWQIYKPGICLYYDLLSRTSWCDMVFSFGLVTSLRYSPLWRQPPISPYSYSTTFHFSPSSAVRCSWAIFLPPSACLSWDITNFIPECFWYHQACLSSIIVLCRYRKLRLIHTNLSSFFTPKKFPKLSGK